MHLALWRKKEKTMHYLWTMISTNRIDMCSNHTPRNDVPRMDGMGCGYREPVDAMTYKTWAVAAAMQYHGSSDQPWFNALHLVTRFNAPVRGPTSPLETWKNRKQHPSLVFVDCDLMLLCHLHQGWFNPLMTGRTLSLILLYWPTLHKIRSWTAPTKRFYSHSLYT